MMVRLFRKPVFLLLVNNLTRTINNKKVGKFNNNQVDRYVKKKRPAQGRLG